MAGQIDPRFDPVFQRGYEGGPDTALRQVPQRQATPQPQVAPPVREQPPVHDATLAPDPTESARGDNAPETAPEEDAPHGWFNPFLLTLAVVAVALIGLGFYLFHAMERMVLETQTRSTSQFEWLSMQVLSYALPMAVALGVATGIGVLFLYAVRWRPRRSR